MNISKELLSEVLGGEHEDKITLSTNKVHYQEKDSWHRHINIHELAHKCKEWAYTKGISLSVFRAIGYDHWTIELYDYSDEFDIMDGFKSEPEAIFKACTWILENKDKQ